MRKSLTALLVLCALSLGGITAVHAVLLPRRDQVEVTETVIYGDPAAAEGVRLTAHTRYGDHLRWETSVTPGAATGAESVYSYYPFVRARPALPDPPDVSLRVEWNEFGRFVPDQPIQYGLDAAWQELFDSARDGEVKQVFRLADYFDYYPLAVHYSFSPYLVRTWVTFDDLSYENEWNAAGRAFQNFFRIPVREDERMALSLTRETGGGVGSRGTDYSLSGHFYFNTSCAFAGDACYLSFDPHDDAGEPVDTSLIPGGYGVYRLPLDWEKLDDGQLDGARPDRLAMVYPLDPAHELLGLSADPEGTSLLIHTREEGNYVLTVVDLAGMTARQRFELPCHDDSYGGFALFDCGDFFAVLYEWGYLALFERNSAGAYVQALDVALRPTEGTDFSLRTGWCPSVLAWDGERLAIADREEYRDFYLAVYDRDGMAYLGRYGTGLTGCSMDYYHPVDLEWMS